MFDAIAGYYDGEHIVLNENVQLTNGQKVMVVIMEEKSPSATNVFDFSKYRLSKEHNFPMDGQNYVKELRNNDRM